MHNGAGGDLVRRPFAAAKVILPNEANPISGHYLAASQDLIAVLYNSYLQLSCYAANLHHRAA
jgi:hypothetical protein